MKLDDAAARLEALGNPTRLAIYRTLVKVGERGIAVGKLQARMGAAASTLSHHLQKLIQVGLVTQERQATTLICRANFPVMSGLVTYLTEECCSEEKSCSANAA
ncbi:MAG: helix-turn-helix transcriptional regulator [Rhizobiales bacterium]|nr:helix-turn-helix transcriptional regulator [Hyphomicrobiales bacterium]